MTLLVNSICNSKSVCPMFHSFIFNFIRSFLSNSNFNFFLKNNRPIRQICTFIRTQTNGESQLFVGSFIFSNLFNSVLTSPEVYYIPNKGINLISFIQITAKSQIIINNIKILPKKLEKFFHSWGLFYYFDFSEYSFIFLI